MVRVEDGFWDENVEEQTILSRTTVGLGWRVCGASKSRWSTLLESTDVVWIAEVGLGE